MGGVIAETLMFYNSAHIIVSRGILTDLLRTVGPDNLISLLDDKTLTASYSRANAGVITNVENYVPAYAFGFYIIGTKAKAKLSKYEEVQDVVERTLGKSRQNRAIARRLADHFLSKEIVSAQPPGWEGCEWSVKRALDVTTGATIQVLGDPALRPLTLVA